MNQDFSAVVFDMDGVIFDSERCSMNLWVEMAAQKGIKDMDKVYPKILGTNLAMNRQIMDEAYGEGFFDPFVKEAHDEFDRRYGEGRLPVKKGTLALLLALRKAGIRTAVASSTSHDIVERQLREADLYKYFDAVIGGDMVARSKPFPDIFLKACEEIGAEPSKAVGIEDSHNGIRAVHAAGMRPIMVPDLLPATDEMKNLAEAILTDLDEVLLYLHLQRKEMSFDDFKNEVIRITGKPYEAGYLTRIREVLDDVFSHTIVDDQTGLRLITGYKYGQVYDWDLYFESIFAAYAGEYRLAANNLKAFFARQREDGFIKRSFGSFNFGEHHPFKPFIAQTMLLYYRGTGDKQFLETYFSQTEKWLASYYALYDHDGNGLCAWINADASGMDNQNSRVLPDGFGEGVDLNCYLYREHMAVAEIARILGKDFAEKAVQYQEKAREIARKINDCLWDDEDGFYYDRDERTGAFVKEKGISGFIPLWCEIVPKARVSSLIAHLTDEKEFWSAYPICTLSKTSAVFDATAGGPPPEPCNWNGTSWVVTNYMVFHGLMNYGFENIARKLAEKTLEMVYCRNEHTREYYNSLTGEGCGMNPFYGWSSLGYVMLYEFFMKKDPTSLMEGADLLFEKP